MYRHNYVLNILNKTTTKDRINFLRFYHIFCLFYFSFFTVNSASLELTVSVLRLFTHSCSDFYLC